MTVIFNYTSSPRVKTSQKVFFLFSFLGGYFFDSHCIVHFRE